MLAMRKNQARRRAILVLGACLLLPAGALATEEVPSASGRNGLAQWKRACHSAIARRARYPARLKPPEGQGPSGTTMLRVRVDRQGAILQVSVATPSGIPEFDEAALDAVRRADPLPAAPEDVTALEPTLLVPLSFRSR